MSERGPPNDFETEATAWAIRIDADGLDPAAEAALETWLAGDRRRRGALLRAQAALSLLDRGRALPKTPPAAASRFHGLVSRRAAVAAGVGVLAAGGATWLAWPEPGRRYRTAVGEIRRVPLPDGSLAAINTNSQLEVAVTPTKRQVKLGQGEAWFQVAKDAERPFVVEAGLVRVRAVGTAFSVRVLDHGVDVAVTEGVVETWAIGGEAQMIRLAAGAKAFVTPQEPLQAMAAPVEIDRKLAWRGGQIALDGESLAAAAAEFNRYNTRKVVIDDPVLASEGLVGFFNTNEPESFARAAAATLDARVVEDGEYIRLVRGPAA
jgi:transmembrane sensor